MYNNKDIINHPSHYCRENARECLDEMEAVFGRYALKDFCLLNVWKYRYRASAKNGEEDLAKSDFYMAKYLELLNKDKEDSMIADQRARQKLIDKLELEKKYSNYHDFD